MQSRSGLIGCGGDLLERPCLAARPLKAHQYCHRRRPHRHRHRHHQYRHPRRRRRHFRRRH